MTAIVLLPGTLDTKGEEYGFVRDRLRELGCTVVLADVGVAGSATVAADVTRDEVARRAGVTIEALLAGNDRGRAMAAMADGATALALELHASGGLHGVLAAGGSGGSSVATAAMRALPIGLPKLMVSTIAAGNVAPYVGSSDIAMQFPVLDIAGLNTITRRVLDNAATAMAAMAERYRQSGPVRPSASVVAITMFGVTTMAADAARRWLEAAGHEVLVFHANGAGGRAMEQLVRQGIVRGCLDLTTTELADELVGGRMSAGPDRLEAAGRESVPQVVSLGALDMVNWGPPDDVPERFRARRLHRHNPMVTLMRTDATETAALGRTIARKLNAATGPVALFIPLGGVSAIARPGEVFHDPDADRALFEALEDELDPRIERVCSDAHINDPDFAVAMARRLHDFMRH